MAVAFAGWLLLAAVAAPAPAKPALARPPDVTFEIRFYGERPLEIIELFVPFLATFQFAERGAVRRTS